MRALKENGTRDSGSKVQCYGGFSERWKHDDYERRKNWFRRNRMRIIICAAICASAVAVLLFLLLK